MKITPYLEAQLLEGALDARIMHKSDTLEVVHLHLYPHQKVQQHSNKIDIVICVIEGQVVLETESKPIILDRFDAIEVPSGSERALNNDTDSDTRLLILKKLK
jgi:quercetin dioxygenase-like cupin family protein